MYKRFDREKKTLGGKSEFSTECPPVYNYNLLEGEYVSFPQAIEGFDFVPSFQTDEIFKLLHIHIPECAGLTFEKPIDILKHYIIDPKGSQVALHSGRMSNQSLVNKCPVEDIPSCYSVHNVDWERLYTDQTVVAFIRDPHERLNAHIYKMINEKNWSYEQLDEYIENAENYHKQTIHQEYNAYYFNNVIDYHCRGRDYIHYVKWDDKKSYHALKSHYLSSASLPNILQFDYIPVIPQPSLDSRIVERYNRCIDKGYLEKDNIDYKWSTFETCGKLVHPYTFIVRKGWYYKLVRTEELDKEVKLLRFL